MKKGVLMGCLGANGISSVIRRLLDAGKVPLSKGLVFSGPGVPFLALSELKQKTPLYFMKE
jgi:hypothetical protein